MPASLGLLVATLSGLYTSLWGAFKDCPYENFKPRTFPRSIYFSLLIFGFYTLLARLFADFGSFWSQMGIVQSFFFVMGIERFVSELYKGFFRHEDQSKYFIPSRITFFGKPVVSETLRLSLGILLVSLTLAAALLPFPMQSYTQFLVVAYVTGLFVSFGGAYKDAPFEGFDWVKFQRSALVLACSSPLFFKLGPAPLGVLIYMNGGLERFLVEYYKTYIKRNMSGKFRPDLHIYVEQKQRREKFHLLALALIAGLLAMYIYELRGL